MADAMNNQEQTARLTFTCYQSIRMSI